MRLALSLFLTTLLILAITPQTAYSQNLFKSNVECHYALKYGGKMIGYSVYRTGSNMSLAGEDFIKYRSLSIVRAGIGNITESVFQADFSVDVTTGLPSYFLMQQNIGGFQAVSETVYSDGVIAQKNGTEKNVATFIHETDNSCYLFTANLWGRVDSFIEHYYVLIQAAKGAKETEFYVYDPILRTEGTLTLIREPEVTLDFKGKQVKTDVYTLRNYYGIPSMKIWYSQRESKIYKIAEIGGDLSIELSNNKAAEELKKAPGVDLGLSRAALSPVYFTDFDSVRMISVSGNIFGRGIKTKDYEVLGFSQKFNGDVSEDGVSGTFTVKKTDIKIDKPNRFPPFKLGEKFDVYLKAQPGIESSDDYIVNKAQEITWKSRDCRTAAGKIASWINENIKDGVSLPSALITFNTGQGNQESKSLLMTAMCRAAGIPARMAGGIIFEKGELIPGYWCEVYIENSGWLPFDVSKGKEGVNCDRVYLYEIGDLSKISLEGVDFLPKPPKRTPFHQKDIFWPLGESRTYEIKINDKVIGKERARVADMIFGEEGENYLFESEVLMKVAGVDFRAYLDASFDIKALPVSCDFKSEIGDSLSSGKFKFTDKYIQKILRVDEEGNEVTSNIPYSKGTYLLDNRFLSLWCLAIGQIPRIEIGGKYRFTAFMPENMKIVKLELEAKNFERVEAEGGDANAFRCETNTGMIFHIDQSGKVLKISIPAQKLEFTLLKSEVVLGDDLQEPLVLDSPSSDGSSVPSDGSAPSSDGSSVPSDGSAPSSDGSSVPSDGSAPSSDGSSVPSDGSAPSSDGSSVPSDGSAPSSDGSSVPSDGSAPSSDGSGHSGK